MDDAGVALLVMALLAVPVLIVILLVVYIVKTNRLTRQVAELDSNLRLIGRDVAALVRDARDVQRLRISPRTTPSSVPIDAAPPASEPSGQATISEAPSVPQPQAPVTPPPQVPVVSPPVSRPAEATPPMRPELPPIVHVPQRPAVLRPLAAQAGAGATLPRETLHRVPPPPRAPSRTKAEWEALVGGKLLNRIGALALIFGVFFFLKYAYDKNWIPPWIRVGIALLIGASLVLGGTSSHKRGMQVFAQGLIGAGIAILYAAGYVASPNYYGVVDQKTAFLMMSVVTVVTFTLAFKYNSLAVSFLGWAGGFLTPFLLSTGHANEVGLFTYIALLDAGLLAVLARKEAWAILEPLTLAATYLIYVLWYSKYHTPSDLMVTVTFLSTFWLLFLALDVYRLVRPPAAHPEVRHMVAVFSAVFYYLALFELVYELHHQWMALATMIIGAIYLLSVLVARRGRPRDVSFHRFILTAVVLLVLATAIQYTGFGFKMVFFWSVEALALIGCAAYWEMRPVRNAAFALFALAFIKLFLTGGALSYSSSETFTLLANPRALAFFTLAAAIGASVLVLGKRGPKSSRMVLELLNYAWCLLLFTLLAVETNDYFSQHITMAAEQAKAQLEFNRALVLGLVLTGYSVSLVWFGTRAHILAAVASGLAVLAIAFLIIEFRSFEFSPIEDFNLLVNSRAGAAVLLLAALPIHIRLLKLRFQSSKWIGEVTSAILWAWCILLFTLLTAETVDYFRLRIIREPRMLGALAFTKYLTLAIVWIAYSLPLVWYGLKLKLRPAIWSGLAALAGAIFLLATWGIKFEPITGFRLLINYRAAAMLFALAALLLHSEWTKAKGRMRMTAVMLSVWCIILLLLCTVETHDHFRRLRLDASGTELDRLEFTEGMALVMVWTAYSLPLIWYGLKRKAPPVLGFGLAALLFAALSGAVAGFEFAPINGFSLLLNVRAAALAFVIVALLVLARWLSRTRDQFKWIDAGCRVLRIGIALLVLLLMTVETRDYFGKSLFDLNQQIQPGLATTAQLSADINRLTNLEQMALSLVWLVYSILLIGFGIWRRVLALRILAIVIFGITILKIFIYDLSFLETLYRIFSFIGLGLILLTVSFLYQRYKTAIFDTGPREPASDAAGEAGSQDTLSDVEAEGEA
jgi:uncharacterized membrane protein